jgi:transcriptional regulator with XRE-family HTH domain
MNARDFHRALGQRIADLRKEQQMTQAELARALGLSQQSVFAIELGDRRVSVDKLSVLMRVLRVSCEQLLGIKQLTPVTKATLAPAEQRHVEQLRNLTRGDRRVVMRVTEALRRQ